MAKVPNGIETLRKISRVHERWRQTDDRQTTDERTMTYSSGVFRGKGWWGFKPPMTGRTKIFSIELKK